MFKINSKNQKEYCGTQEDWEKVKEIAEQCNDFEMDVEDEIVSDDLRSCYNCLFRRWTAKSFVCTKK